MRRDTCSSSPSNLAIEGIFTFLFGPQSTRWGCESDFGRIRQRYQARSATVKRFCILRSLNTLFWERSYEFLQSLPESELCFYGNLPPLTIIQESRVNKLHLKAIKVIGRLDLSSLLSVKDLELWNVGGNFSLTPPPNLETIKIYDSNIDMVDLIQGLKETKIIKLEIEYLRDIGRLDLSSLLFVKDLELLDIDGRFSLTPPPNLEILRIAYSEFDMVDLIQGLKETKITKLEIGDLKGIDRLDLSSLLSIKDLELRFIDVYVKDLELRFIDGSFSLTPPPNLEIFKFNNWDVDMVYFNNSGKWVPGHLF